MAKLPPFPRTECACSKCVDLCSKPAHLIPGDIFAIADRLITDGKITTRQEVFGFLRASRGAVVGEVSTGKLFRIGTITPCLKDGKCVFLTEDNKCSIHSVAPFGCAFFDWHMGAIEGHGRSMWGLKQISMTPGYEALRQKLIADQGGEAAEPFTLPQEEGRDDGKVH